MHFMFKYMCNSNKWEDRERSRPMRIGKVDNQFLIALWLKMTFSQLYSQTGCLFYKYYHPYDFSFLFSNITMIFSGGLLFLCFVFNTITKIRRQCLFICSKTKIFHIYWWPKITLHGGLYLIWYVNHCNIKYSDMSW